ncbi:MAG: hypothetical protein O7C75_04250 [Verrucomicrobia bacterium]|nr:hypothetical protein [Verrucomicrobiota bacterium]
MSELWAITSFFNPAGYNRRIENYRIFRNHLSVPLATAELSYNGHFVLEESDSDILVKIKGEDIMWQKERLLNLLVNSLPEACDYVAWIDCDVIFDSKNWAMLTMDALDQFKLVQLFEHREDLPRGAISQNMSQENTTSVSELSRTSVGYQLSHGGPVKNDFLRSSGVARATTGLAWACRRELLESHSLYDACIIGGGDRIILAAAMGWFDLAVGFHKMSGPWKDHYLSWARKFYESTHGRVGCVPGRLFHLWHGDLRDRKYVKRINILKQHYFDPFTDIVLDSHGIWKWASDKPDLHKMVCKYFANRHEDGRD